MRVLEGLKASVMMMLPTALLLLVPAALASGGDWVWPRALWFLAVLAVMSVVGNVALATLRPANFETRKARPTQKQPLIDVIGLIGYLGYVVGWVLFLSLDARVWHLLPAPPAWLSAAGGLLAIIGSLVSSLAVWHNAFASPNIEDQADRGQHVVDTGIYGLIRHPLYAGNLLLFAGAALWLGSTAALIGVSVHLVATLARIRIEEAFLRENLPDYAAYASRVRARLIPFVA